MRFKTERIEKEWNDKRLDFGLRIIALTVDWYCTENFGRDIQLTDIYRTQEEQDRYYKDDPNYKIQKWYSTHQFWRAIDVGVNKYSESQRQELCNYINKHFNYKGSHNTCVYHNVGKGWHFHLQTDWLKQMVVYK